MSDPRIERALAKALADVTARKLAEAAESLMQAAGAYAAALPPTRVLPDDGGGLGPDDFERAHKSAPPLAGADPPWLDEAIRMFDETARISSTTAALRAALRFAARQPRPITEKFVKDFADELGQTEMGLYSHDDIHHALEAAEAERARGDGDG